MEEEKDLSETQEENQPLSVNTAKWKKRFREKDN